METKIITTDELNKFVNNVISSDVVTYGVQNKEQDPRFKKYHFAKLCDASDLCLDYDVTNTSPKSFFTPSKETLFKYKNDPELKVETTFDTEKRVLIGVHPYDMIAINQMDEVFKDKYEDKHYFSRRNNTVVIGVDPQNASEKAFWCLVNAGTVENGYDIWLTKLDDNTYFVEAKTDAGKELLSKHANTTNATDEHSCKKDQVRANLHSVCNSDRKIAMEAAEIPHIVKENWEHPMWKEKADKCYGCGSCNLVCPTCYCFDVHDDIDIDLKGGERTRTWDGCLLENFAAVAGGENFREHKVDRFKHRFYRKTLYMFEKYKHLACVGCGRCSSVCLPDIADPVDSLNRLKEEK